MVFGNRDRNTHQHRVEAALARSAPATGLNALNAPMPSGVAQLNSTAPASTGPGGGGGYSEKRPDDRRSDHRGPGNSRDHDDRRRDDRRREDERRRDDRRRDDRRDDRREERRDDRRREERRSRSRDRDKRRRDRSRSRRRERSSEGGKKRSREEEKDPASPSPDPVRRVVAAAPMIGVGRSADLAAERENAALEAIAQREREAQEAIEAKEKKAREEREALERESQSEMSEKDRRLAKLKADFLQKNKKATAPDPPKPPPVEQPREESASPKRSPKRSPLSSPVLKGVRQEFREAQGVLEKAVGDMFDSDDETMVAGVKPQSQVLDTTGETWDTEEGYYNWKPGEVLNGEWTTIESGSMKGTYSNVVRVQATGGRGGGGEFEEGALAVVKIIRNQGHMRRDSMKEIAVLRELQEPHPQLNIVRLYDDFDYHNHLCMVLEPLDYDLEKAIYGERKGIEGKSMGLAATKRFSRHIFRALRHMKKMHVIHGDIKPANILVDAKTQTLKLCDYGQATKHNPAKPHLDVHLGSMWYRPPEIILSSNVNHGVDVWQAAVVLYEVLTGKVMFPGKNNNDMLYLYQRCKGRFPSKTIKKSAEMLAKLNLPAYFDAEQKFLHMVKDPSVPNKHLVKPWLVGDKPEVSLKAMTITPAISEGWGEGEQQTGKQLLDLLHGCLLLNTEARTTAEQAMKHDFVLSVPASEAPAVAAPVK